MENSTLQGALNPGKACPSVKHRQHHQNPVTGPTELLLCSYCTGQRSQLHIDKRRSCFAGITPRPDQTSRTVCFVYLDVLNRSKRAKGGENINLLSVLQVRTQPASARPVRSLPRQGSGCGRSSNGPFSCFLLDKCCSGTWDPATWKGGSIETWRSRTAQVKQQIVAAGSKTPQSSYQTLES
eukprot:766696-Hanusia_phi.AAC.3